MAIADLNFPPHFVDAQDSLTLTTFDSLLRVSACWLQSQRVHTSAVPCPAGITLNFLRILLPHLFLWVSCTPTNVGTQLTGVDMDPFVVEKQTLLMLLLSELFQQKGMPVASTNVTSVNLITSACQSAGRRNTAGRYITCLCASHYHMHV